MRIGKPQTNSTTDGPGNGPRQKRLTSFEQDCEENNDPVYDFDKILDHKLRRGEVSFVLNGD